MKNHFKSTIFKYGCPAITALLAVATLAGRSGLAAGAALPDDSLLNSGFEDVSGKLPSHWEPLMIGAESEFVLDTEHPHSGRQSLRIQAQETTRSYIRSGRLPVSGGERVKVSAWVRHEGVPPGKGTVIGIAEFTNAQDANSEVAKIDVADSSHPQPEWRELSGSVRVPEQAAFLRIRLGFSYSYGTCWWDDVSVQFEEKLAARLGLASSLLSPALGGLPIEIINRGKETATLTVVASVGKQRGQTELKLTGEPIQRTTVPLNVGERGNKVPVELAVSRDGRIIKQEKKTVLVPPALILVPPAPTHWAVEDGPPQIECRVETALDPETLKTAEITATLVGLDGAIHAKWTTHGKRVADGANDFALAAKRLPEGNYRIIAQVISNGGKSQQVEQPWQVIPREMARVTLNSGGYPVSNGKVIFPLGIYNGGGKMKECGQAGFTVSHAYNAVEAKFGTRPDDARAREFLDQTLANGMKALMLVPRNLAFHGDWEGVKRRIRMFRNHPGLLAWDEEEGIARGDIKVEVLQRLHDIARQEDPHHPIMVGDSRLVIGRMPLDRADFFPEECMDMGMWWWYPLPLGAEGTALEGDEGPRGTELTPPSFLVNRQTQKPVWVGVQSYKKPKAWARYPNPTEYRAQAYIALAHGAKGLMWYGGSVTGGMYLKPEEANWSYVKTLARELSDVAPVLAGEDLPAPAITPANLPISTAIRRGAGRTLLITANRGDKRVAATFSSELFKNGAAPVISESREVKIEHCALKDVFDPYAVHVYELR